MPVQIGVDVGGTFTDISALINGQLFRAKAYSTKDVTTGIVDVIAKLCNAAKIDESDLLSRVDKFVLGNTIVTNAIDEERWAKVGLLTTYGFRDSLRIGRCARGPGRDPHQYRPRPEIVERACIEELLERVDAHGTVLSAVAEDDVRAAMDRLMQRGVQAVAVSFLWSFRNPQNENAVGSIIERDFPGVPYTLSSDLAPVFREYERTVTTVLDAGVKPIVANHFESLAATLKSRGLATDIKIMQVDGGFVSLGEAMRAPIKMFNSGPAGGVEGARRLGAALGTNRVITGDMGGTSYDAAVIVNGECRVLPRAEIGPFPTALTAVDIASIGAGGGSLAWIDARGLLRVGPQSVGSTPGPACYGRGGTEPSVTDASVALGLIDPDYFLGGTIKLSMSAAVAAIQEKLAKPLGLSTEKAAAGIHELAIHQMANAVRTLTVNRGHDPREFVLVSFGGAAGLFSAQIAKLCNVQKVVVPSTASVFSSYGLLNSDSMLTTVKTSPGVVTGRLNEIEQEFRALEARIDAWFQSDDIPAARRTTVREADMKFAGQIFDISTRLPSNLTSDMEEQIEKRFIADYEREFGAGTAWAEAEILVTNLRVRGIGSYALQSERRDDVHGTQTVQDRPRSIFDPMLGKRFEVPVFRAVGQGQQLTGPLIVEEPDTTIYVPAGMTLNKDSFDNYVIEVFEQPVSFAPVVEESEQEA
ncbi:hydantoinase/oxoprolinase family protein [Burkholderia sp. JPY481]